MQPGHDLPSTVPEGGYGWSPSHPNQGGGSGAGTPQQPPIEEPPVDEPPTEEPPTEEPPTEEPPTEEPPTEEPPTEEPPTEEPPTEEPPTEEPPTVEPPTEEPPTEEPPAGYTYRLHLINPHIAYTRAEIHLFLETNNPNPHSLHTRNRNSSGSFVGGITGEVRNFIDVEFTGNDSFNRNIRSVPGGFLIRVGFQEGQVGLHEIIIQEIDPDVSLMLQPESRRIVVASVQIYVKCHVEARNNLVDSVIANATNDSMTMLEKVTAINTYIHNNFRYFSNTRGYESPGRIIHTLANAGPMQHRRESDSHNSPALMVEAVRRLGISNENANWGVPGLHYSIVKVTINGVNHTFSPTQPPEGNSINPDNIQMFVFPNTGIPR